MDNLKIIECYLEDLYFKIKHESMLTEKDQKIINYINFILNLNSEKKEENYSKILKEYHSSR